MVPRGSTTDLNYLHPRDLIITWLHNIPQTARKRVVANNMKPQKTPRAPQNIIKHVFYPFGTLLELFRKIVNFAFLPP